MKKSNKKTLIIVVVMLVFVAALAASFAVTNPTVLSTPSSFSPTKSIGDSARELPAVRDKALEKHIIQNGPVNEQSESDVKDTATDSADTVNTTEEAVAEGDANNGWSTEVEISDEYMIASENDAEDESVITDTVSDGWTIEIDVSDGEFSASDVPDNERIKIDESIWDGWSTEVDI